MNKFGYACINMELSKKDITTNRSMIRRTFDQKGISYASDLALKNCTDLNKILQWNHKNNILFFRLSSNLFPWSSEYELEQLKDYSEISNQLSIAGAFAKKVGMRITAHPGPFNKLCSSDDGILSNTIKDLRTHGEVFDLMGLDRTPYYKMNIHVGASYGDKESTADVFCKNFEKLPDSVSKRLTVENDDKESLFSTKDLVNMVSKKIGIPIVHDQHHHGFCTGGLSQLDAMQLAFTTWKDITPVIHYSESKSEESNDKRIKPQAHSNLIIRKIETYGLKTDVMIEAKFKEIALQKYIKEFES